MFFYLQELLSLISPAVVQEDQRRVRLVSIYLISNSGIPKIIIFSNSVITDVLPSTPILHHGALVLSHLILVVVLWCIEKVPFIDGTKKNCLRSWRKKNSSSKLITTEYIHKIVLSEPSVQIRRAQKFFFRQCNLSLGIMRLIALIEDNQWRVAPFYQLSFSIFCHLTLKTTIDA